MTSSQRGPGATLPAATYRAVLEMVYAPGPALNAAQVFKELQRRRLANGASLRIVQRMLKDLQPRDDSGPWSMAMAAPEDAALVLDVVRVLIEESDTANAWSARLSADIAHWVLRIRKSYPDLQDLALVYYAAALARRGGGFLGKVETFLAFTPWRDDGEALARAIDRKLVSFDIAFTFGYETQVIRHQGRLSRERKEQRK